MATVEKAPRSAQRPGYRSIFEWLRAPELWPALWEEADAMRVEELVDGDELVVRAELAGIDPERDVQITVTDHVLEIRAERRQEEKVEEKDYRRSEIRYGSFTRRIPLPAEASEADVKATYKDGILEVRMPVAGGGTEPARIPVQRA